MKIDFKKKTFLLDYRLCMISFYLKKIFLIKKDFFWNKKISE
jgi:hypothetical protein